MAKIRLGERPENFKHTVKFPMLDGTTGLIKVSYKYRTRKEFGIFIDGMVSDAKAEKVEDAEFSMSDLMDKTAGSNGQYIMKAVDGWDLDEEFNIDNVQQLADELPAAVNAIMEDYRRAILEGRLGN